MSVYTTSTAVTTFQIAVNESVVLDGQTRIFTPVTGGSDVFVNGNAAVANGIDDHYEKTVTLAASASVVFTMSALTDTLPRVNPFTGIRALLVSITTRTAGDYLTVEPNVTNGWTAWIPTSSTLKVYKNAGFDIDLTDAFTVSSGSNDQLKIINSGSNPITFTFGCIGVTN